MKNTKIFIILFFLFLGVSLSANAQKFWRRSEIGVLVGGSTYMGDLNDMSPFSQPSFAGGLLYRYTINQRLVAKADALYGGMKGGNPDVNEKRNLSFNSYLFEFSGQMEYNFLPYYTGTRFWWSPYIFAGLGFCTFNPKATAPDGTTYNLRDLTTEGQTSSAYPDRTQYSLVQLAIPMGIGFKFSLSKFVSMGVEYGLRLTFSDYLDDVSTTYVGEDVLREIHRYDGLADASVTMADRTVGGPNPEGSARGNSAMNDWYSYFGVTLTVSLRSFFPQSCSTEGTPMYYKSSQKSRKRNPSL